MTSETSSKARLRVPKGFYNVLEVFVRDLLKNTPEDVFDYGAEFFENLLHIRTDIGHDPAIHGAMSEESFTNLHVDKTKGRRKSEAVEKRRKSEAIEKRRKSKAIEKHRKSLAKAKSSTDHVNEDN